MLVTFRTRGSPHPSRPPLSQPRGAVQLPPPALPGSARGRLTFGAPGAGLRYSHPHGSGGARPRGARCCGRGMAAEPRRTAIRGRQIQVLRTGTSALSPQENAGGSFGAGSSDYCPPTQQSSAGLTDRRRDREERENVLSESASQLCPGSPQVWAWPLL